LSHRVTWGKKPRSISSEFEKRSRNPGAGMEVVPKESKRPRYAADRAQAEVCSKERKTERQRRTKALYYGKKRAAEEGTSSTKQEEKKLTRQSCCKKTKLSIISLSKNRHLYPTIRLYREADQYEPRAARSRTEKKRPTLNLRKGNLDDFQKTP